MASVLCARRRMGSSGWLVVFFLFLSFSQNEVTAKYNTELLYKGTSDNIHYHRMPPEFLCQESTYYFCIRDAPLHMGLLEKNEHTIDGVREAAMLNLSMVDEPGYVSMNLFVEMWYSRNPQLSCMFMSATVRQRMIDTYSIERCEKYVVTLQLTFQHGIPFQQGYESAVLPWKNFRDIMPNYEQSMGLPFVVRWTCDDFPKYKEYIDPTLTGDSPELFCLVHDRTNSIQCTTHTCVERCSDTCHSLLSHHLLQPDILYGFPHSVSSLPMERIIYRFTEFTADILIICGKSAFTGDFFLLTSASKHVLKREYFPTLSGWNTCVMVLKEDIESGRGSTRGLNELSIQNYPPSQDVYVAMASTKNIVPVSKTEQWLNLPVSYLNVIVVSEPCFTHNVEKVCDETQSENGKRYDGCKGLLFQMERMFSCWWVFVNESARTTENYISYRYQPKNIVYLHQQKSLTIQNFPTMVSVYMEPFNGYFFEYICLITENTEESIDIVNSIDVKRITSPGVSLPVKYYHTRYNITMDTGNRRIYHCLCPQLGQTGSIKSEMIEPSMAYGGSESALNAAQYTEVLSNNRVHLLFSINIPPQYAQLELVRRKIQTSSEPPNTMILSYGQPFLAVRQNYLSPYHKFVIVHSKSFFSETENFSCASCSCVVPPCQNSNRGDGYFRIYKYNNYASIYSTVSEKTDILLFTSNVQQLPLPPRRKTFYYTFDSPPSRFTWSMPLKKAQERFLITICYWNVSDTSYRTLTDATLTFSTAFSINFPLKIHFHFTRQPRKNIIESCMMLHTSQIRKRLQKMGHFNSLYIEEDLHTSFFTLEIPPNYPSFKHLSMHLSQESLNETVIHSRQPVVLPMQPQLFLTLESDCSASTSVSISTPYGSSYRHVAAIKHIFSEYDPQYPTGNSCSLIQIWTGTSFDDEDTSCEVTLLNLPHSHS